MNCVPLPVTESKTVVAMSDTETNKDNDVQVTPRSRSTGQDTDDAGDKNAENTSPPDIASEAPGDKPDLPVDSFVNQLDAVTAECDDLREKWLRTQAELENVRKRAQKELEELGRYQAIPLARDLLPALDNLNRAVHAAEQSGNLTELLEGLNMVLAQIDGILAARGATPIETEGRPFDPNLHQALQQVPSGDHEPMTILQEVQRGYRLHDRVIRPSQVIVSCALPEPADAPEDSDDNSNDAASGKEFD